MAPVNPPRLSSATGEDNDADGGAAVAKHLPKALLLVGGTLSSAVLHNLNCIRHCSTETEELQSTRQQAVTPTRNLPAPQGRTMTPVGGAAIAKHLPETLLMVGAQHGIWLQVNVHIGALHVSFLKSYSASSGYSSSMHRRLVYLGADRLNVLRLLVVLLQAPTLKNSTAEAAGNSAAAVKRQNNVQLKDRRRGSAAFTFFLIFSDHHDQDMNGNKSRRRKLLLQAWTPPSPPPPPIH
ncbi:hypothetical protein TYRP_008926 [Tyrophagus putrescentiae]|nr:hypothetical protein TYRP_008926 [Tyrophagus putrescentiae]